MRGDLPEWATRLSAELPSRRHERQSGYGVETRGGDTTRKPSKKRIVTGRGRGGCNARPITVDGKTYPSFAAVCRDLSIGHSTIYKWLDSGRATRPAAY